MSRHIDPAAYCRRQAAECSRKALQATPIAYASARSEVVGKRDDSAMAGHLGEAHVRPTLEVIVTESPAHLSKIDDPKTGLAPIRPNARAARRQRQALHLTGKVFATASTRRSSVSRAIFCAKITSPATKQISGTKHKPARGWPHSSIS
jgi:hypothetical protein